MSSREYREIGKAILRRRCDCFWLNQQLQYPLPLQQLSLHLRKFIVHRNKMKIIAYIHYLSFQFKDCNTYVYFCNWNKQKWFGKTLALPKEITDTAAALVFPVKLCWRGEKNYSDCASVGSVECQGSECKNPKAAAPNTQQFSPPPAHRHPHSQQRN